MDEKTDTRRMKAILALAAAVAFASAPFWTSGFGGFDPNRYPIPQIDPPIQPAGYAFSIWGVIYLWLIASAGFGLLMRAEDANWDSTRWPMIVSLAVGTPWITVAQVSPVWATVMIWVMLIAAIGGLLRAPAQDRWWLAAPLGLYAGWLTAASFVSLALLAAGYGVVAGQTAWGWAALLAALATGIAVQRMARYAALYGVAIAWALVAITVRNAGTDLVFAASAATGAAIMLAASVNTFRKS